MRSDTTAPEVTVYKGQLVTVTDAAKAGWRRLTAAERNAWYEHFHAECYEIAGSPFDEPSQTATGRAF